MYQLISSVIKKIYIIFYVPFLWNVFENSNWINYRQNTGKWRNKKSWYLPFQSVSSLDFYNFIYSFRTGMVQYQELQEEVWSASLMIKVSLLVNHFLFSLPGYVLWFWCISIVFYWCLNIFCWYFCVYVGHDTIWKIQIKKNSTTKNTLYTIPLFV